MGKLIYAANISLDGFLEDEEGSFDWSVPDEDVHRFWNEHERQIGTSLYGRGMYETMRVWESGDWLTNEPAVVREYAAIWRNADKVVYFTSVTDVSTARTRIERQFEPEAVRRLRRPAPRTRASEARGSRPTPSGTVWSMSVCCCCARSSSAAASRRCLEVYDWTSSCWTSGDSITAWSTSATRSDTPPTPAGPNLLEDHVHNKQ